MRTLFVLFALLAVNAIAQDTLFYKKGDVKAVRIIEIDTSLQIIGYIHQGDTLYIAKSALSSYALHSDIKDSISLNTQTENSETIPFDKNNPIKSRTVSKFEYGKFSIGLNLLSLIPMKILGTTVASPNSVINAFGEYSLNSHLGIGFNVRLGLKTGSSNAIDFNGYQDNPIRLTIFETGIQPTIYFGRQELRNTFYFRPGLYLGKNYTVVWHEYRNYFEFDIPYSEMFRELEMKANFYYRVGGTLGLQFNPWKSISISMDAGAFFGNWANSQTILYQNTFENEKYEKYSVREHRRRIIGTQCTLILIYRFGSKLRE